MRGASATQAIASTKRGWATNSMVAGALAIAVCLGCGYGDPSPQPAAAAPDSGGMLPTERPATLTERAATSADDLAQADSWPRFEDVASEIGVDFQPYCDQVPGRFFLPEIMGSGVAWLDYDLDGHLDLYFANGCQLDPAVPPTATHANQLFRQHDLGTFVCATEASHSGDRGFGQGIAAGDFDADGFPDIFVANYGCNVLLHNNGDGTFSDATAASKTGLSDDWSSSVCWLDINGDSWLDLFVANYLNATLENNQVCDAHGLPRYCGPDAFAAVPAEVLLGQGDGTFREAAVELGLRGHDDRGLGVVAIDVDNDLLAEIYVANDMSPNFLFSRTRRGADPAAATAGFVDRGFDAGCAVSDQGENEASMGIACGDFDGDHRPDIFLTHFLGEKNTLYANLGGLIFSDESRRAQIAACSFDQLGFGAVASDFDRNGTLDLFIANGHVFGHLQRPHEMLPQLLLNRGRGRFKETSSAAGPYFQIKWLGRAAAGCDYDNDGDLDVAVTHVGKPVAILRNDTKNANHFVGLEPWTRSRVPPVGGRVLVATPQQTQVFPIYAGGSYMASSDTRILCGLGSYAGPVTVTVHWPSGHVDTFEAVTTDRYWQLREGSDIRPLR